MDEKQREYVIFAGVNGAGKTTYYHAFDGFPKNRVNVDEILQEMGGNWREPSDCVLAMREAVRQVKWNLENGHSFQQETTLAGRGIRNTILHAKKCGYAVRMFYIGLESADLAVLRVADRVRKGGHGVAESDIRRRYEASLRMLREIIILCDRVDILDNTRKFDRVATYEKGIETFRKECEWYDRIM